MDSRSEKYLWEELKLLQPIIDKFDDFTFRIKNWFITIFVAVSGYSIGKSEPKILLINLFVLFSFYFYEITYRMAHASFLERHREIQKILREDREPNDEEKSPNIDKYLFPIGGEPPDSKWVEFYTRLGITDERAHKNAAVVRDILRESRARLFQPRVSLIYGVSFVLYVLMALFFKDCFVLLSAVLTIVTVYIAVRRRIRLDSRKNMGEG